MRAPLKPSPTSSSYEMCDIPMLQPHSLISYLWDHVGVRLREGDCANYWKHFRDLNVPWAVAHPASNDHIPLGIYGDGARVRQVSFAPVQKIIGIWMNVPLWRPRSCRASRWLLCAVEEELLYRHHTLHAIYTQIAWSLNILFHGVHPSCRAKRRGIDQ